MCKVEKIYFKRRKGVKAFCIKANEMFTFFTMSEDRKERINYNTKSRKHKFL